MIRGELQRLAMQDIGTTADVGNNIVLQLCCAYSKIFGGAIQRIGAIVLQQVHAAVAMIDARRAIVHAEASLHIADSFEQARGHLELVCDLRKCLVVEDRRAGSLAGQYLAPEPEYKTEYQHKKENWKGNILKQYTFSH